MEFDRPIAIVLIIFIIFLIGFFLVVPEYNTFQKLQKELGQKRAEFNAEFDYYAAIAKTYFELQGRQDDVKKIDDALPQNPSLGEVVYFLQETAKGSGLIVKNLSLSKASSIGAETGTNQNNSVKDIGFSVVLLGDYQSLENFIISLEQSSRIFEITSISFSSLDTASSNTLQPQLQGQQTYSFNLQIITHSY